MIGWWIVISTQTPEERRQAVDRKAFILATWEVGLGGLDWLEQLVANGDASRLRNDGYPNVYVVAAEVVLPLLADGPPAHHGLGVIGDDYVMPTNWLGRVEVHVDRIATCPSQQQLTIEAWDLS